MRQSTPGILPAVNVLYYLKERTRLLRLTYRGATAPFEEIRKAISSDQWPFVPPPYNGSEEVEEPFFQAEWHDAGAAIELIGQGCLSFLAASFKLYLDEHRKDMWRGDPVLDSGLARTKGALEANRVWFEGRGIRFEDSGVNLNVLEEILLTRNRIQHNDTLWFPMLSQSASDFEKVPFPFFLSGYETVQTDEAGNLVPPGFPGQTDVQADKLLAAVDIVDTFCTWLDQQ